MCLFIDGANNRGRSRSHARTTQVCSNMTTSFLAERVNSGQAYPVRGRHYGWLLKLKDWHEIFCNIYSLPPWLSKYQNLFGQFNAILGNFTWKLSINWQTQKKLSEKPQLKFEFNVAGLLTDKQISINRRPVLDAEFADIGKMVWPKNRPCPEKTQTTGLSQPRLINVWFHFIMVSYLSTCRAFVWQYYLFPL